MFLYTNQTCRPPPFVVSWGRGGRAKHFWPLVALPLRPRRRPAGCRRGQRAAQQRRPSLLSHQPPAATAAALPLSSTAGRCLQALQKKQLVKAATERSRGFFAPWKSKEEKVRSCCWQLRSMVTCAEASKAATEESRSAAGQLSLSDNSLHGHINISTQCWQILI